MKKHPITGLYFGSFNPVHNGHLMIAEYIINNGYCDDLWFVVSPQNPLKPDNILAPEHHRLNMMKLATKDNPLMKDCDIEFSMSRPSFTIDTLAQIQLGFQNQNFRIIMGTDNLKNIKQWKEWEKIIESYEILVYPRKGSSGLSIKHKNIIWLQEAPLLSISSTQLRSELKKGKNISHCIPEKVYKYILKHKLYQ